MSQVKPLATERLIRAVIVASRLHSHDPSLLTILSKLRENEEKQEGVVLVNTGFENVSLEIERLIEAAKRGEPYVPPYKGRYFREKQLTPVVRVRDPEKDGIFVAAIASLPTDAKLKEIISFDPRTKRLLEKWRMAFDRSFPDWQTNLPFSDFENEMSREAYAISQLKKISGSLEAKSYSTYLSLEIHLKNLEPDVRDFRLHGVDDADTIMSLAHLKPGKGIVLLNKTTAMKLIGVDPDGIPLLELVTEGLEWVKARLEDDNKYWTWPFFQKYLNRRSVVVKGEEQIYCALADMAAQGHEKAFVKNCRSKSGTWTINLAGASFIGDVAARTKASIRPFGLGMEAMMQEHTPFSHEQRFFIVNGRVVASVCSDRNFSTMDRIVGKRLDPRIAILETPEIESGCFDRGITTHVHDRDLAAKFARFARNIAREGKDIGVSDYVVDIGLCERGVAAIEVNGLERSGPYSLDRALITKAFARRL
jgi:hypothetical protein